MGWFFGCKLHVSMKHSGKMVSAALSNGHTADIKMVEQLVKGLKPKADAYNLRRRNKIETVFSLLKGKYNLVTSKDRSVEGYLAGSYASLCAYQLCHQNKPTIRIHEELA